MPTIPAPRTFSRPSSLIGGVAITASAAPLLFFLPGAEERIAAQAAKWGPRWNKGFARMTPRLERSAQRVEPGIQRGVRVVEPPLKRAAL
jgi:hypothetical protein